MRLISKTVAAIAIASMSLPSFAATLQPLQPGVMLNRGSGFRDVAGATLVKAGDIVMTASGGVAQLVYEDGCKVSVNPGGVVAIQELSPCASNAYAADLGMPVKEPPPPVAEWDPSAYLIGGALVAGAVTAAVLLSQNNGNNPPPFVPASP